MIIIIKNILLGLSLTIIIELMVALLLGLKNKNDIFKIIIINSITNPILNYIMMVLSYFIKSKLLYVFLLILELIVVFFESGYYQKQLTYKKINLLLFSLILNGISFLIGCLLF